MLDFLKVSTKPPTKNGTVEVFPKFILKKSTDLMIRGGDFYAIWVEERGLWSTEEDDAIRLIDDELRIFAENYEAQYGIRPHVNYMWDSDSGSIDKWHKYCQKQMRDWYHTLDEKLIFSNTETTKKDFASKKLNYPLEAGDISAYEKLISTLYTEEERHKIEWAIGAIVTGDSKKLHKFMVFYGEAGTGKSTILNIIQDLFEGYYSVFDAKALGSSNNAFALEAFKNNPLVAIQHDGDLSRIEDNTRLNSLVSHELMTVNEKFKSTYANHFNCFLFMGTNRPVKITDAKSGLIRRLIDVSPSGNKLSSKEYKQTVKQVSFELGAIAYHCKEVYLSNPGAYDDYIPTSMMSASNDFYNFVLDSYFTFNKDNGVTLKSAWEMYKTYCDDAKVKNPASQRVFKEELKNYFYEYKDRYVLDDGTRVRSYYMGFRTDRINSKKNEEDNDKKPKSNLIEFKDSTSSYFDEECSDCLAQYASTKETPSKKWEKVTTKLSDIDTSKLHYVKLPENHIVIDFDIPDKDGNKSYERNLEEASKWPPTYAELSKSGCGIHLHYFYNGDASNLSRVYEDHIEIKVFSGNSSLRRKLTKCNNLPIATISSGLPTKGEKKMVNSEVIKSEKGLRNMIKRNLNKEIHPATKPSIDFIYKILEDAYDSGMHYDVTDMRNSVLAFAASSTNQSDYCIKLVNKMPFKSNEQSETLDETDAPIVFYDVEVFPNLFLVNWKVAGEGKPVVRMINPTPAEIEEFIQCNFKLVGFNCRRYDNHILYARLMGYTNEQLFNLSQKIVNAKKNANRDCFFGEAYNISYTDVYDFASAANKMSLKKWEIKLGLHHQELGLPWDEPVPEDMWFKVAEYCDNDVISTEALFNHLSADWTARQILADLAGMSVNTSTNSLTTRIIFGREKNPQSQFLYRNLAEPVHELPKDVLDSLTEWCPDMMKEPHGEAKSLLPYFPGYKYEYGVSTYQEEEVGEGGYVCSNPGMYGNVALLDVSSMHPHSAIAECLFGPRFTKAFREIVEGRVDIKHEAWDVVNDALDGKLRPYIQKVINGEMTSKDLANALKTAINAVYGQTAAKYDNAFRDPRNIDNIVAKRGALFMIDLKKAVQKRGYTVAHIKTDSIKIPDATPEIIDFVMEFGKRYGYTFEHEATYERMCLVNKAVYIAKYASPELCESMYGYIPGDNKKHGNMWTPTGDQFAVPYVFKTLFSKEDILFENLCETFEVKTALYLDMNEGLPDVSLPEKIKALRSKIREGREDDISNKDMKLVDEYKDVSDEELDEHISKGHNYHFVGRVGEFCPIAFGAGGGILLRQGKDKDGNIKYDAATGSKGYRWLESEMVYSSKELRDQIDRSYYDNLVDEAVKTISEFGDFEWFISDEPYEGSELQADNLLPF